MDAGNQTQVPIRLVHGGVCGIVLIVDCGRACLTEDDAISRQVGQAYITKVSDCVSESKPGSCIPPWSLSQFLPQVPVSGFLP